MKRKIRRYRLLNTEIISDFGNSTFKNIHEVLYRDGSLIHKRIYVRKKHFL